MNILWDKIFYGALPLLLDLRLDVQDLVKLVNDPCDVLVEVLHLGLHFLKGSLRKGELFLQMHISSVLLHSPRIWSREM